MPRRFLAVPSVAGVDIMVPGGLNYVPASRPSAGVVAFAPGVTPAGPASASSGSAPAGTSAQPTATPAEPSVPVAGVSPAVEKDAEAAPAGPAASRRAVDGATRSLFGPLDVIVINGGVNLGARPVIAE